MRTVFFLSLVAVAQILGIARVEAKNSLRVDDVLATRSPLVWVLATVRDTHGLPIPDLGVEDFRVLEETGTEGLKPLKVLSAPLSGVDICLAIDSSRQMIGPPLAMARVAGIRLVDNLTENDRVAVVAFTDGVDFSKPIPQFDEKKEIDFTDDRFALRKVINRQYGRGNCPLYDGLAKAIAVTFRQPVGNRAIILFSQGNDAALGGPPDSGSRFYEPKAPITGATRSGIPIYTIGIGNSVNRPYLEGLAMITGGEYLETPRPDELALFLRKTVLRLKQQYLIVYSSTRVDRTGPFQVSLKLGQGEDAIEEASEVALGEIQDGSGSPFIPPSLEARMGEDMPEEMAASLDSLAAGALPVDATTLQSLAGQIPGGTGALSATALQSLASQIPGGAGALSATALQNLASQIPGGTGALSATTLQSLASQIPGGTGALSATTLQSLAGQIPGGTGALSATTLQSLASQIPGGTGGSLSATTLQSLASQIPGGTGALSATTLQSLAGQIPGGTGALSATALQSLASQIPSGTGALSATALQSLAGQIPGGTGALSATALQSFASQIPGGTGALSATALQSLAGQIPGGTGVLSATALQSLAGQIPGGTGALSATALQNLAGQLSAGTGVMDATAMEALALQMSAAKKAREEDTSFAGRMAAFVQDNDQELAIAVGTFLLILMLSVIILKGGRKRRQLTEWSEDESVGVPSIGVYPGSTQIAEDPQPTGPTEASTSSPPSQSKESTLERTLLASALDDSAEETLGETDIIPPPQKDVAFLDVKEGPVSLEAPFRITRNITIGRHPDSDLHLDHATVSRKHARIVLQDLVFTIEDLGSGNGTHLNGLPVIAATPLTNGDEIKMGEVVLVFRR